MKKRKIDIFGATNSLKVLSHLAEHSSKEFLSSEIQRATSISRAGVYFTLKELQDQNLVTKTKRGKFLFYRIVYDDYAMKQFKILKNVLALRILVSKVKPFSRKITLYGSYARGENDPSSDIDLFIIAKEPDEVKNALSLMKIKQKVQAVIKTSFELVEFKQKENVFMNEVDHGIVLWEERE